MLSPEIEYADQQECSRSSRYEEHKLAVFNDIDSSLVEPSSINLEEEFKQKV